MVERVSFDGEVFAGGKDSTKMDQWIARPGDLLVSKIRARQGSVGLVSSSQGLVSASIHYRALTPETDMVDPVFIWLALRSDYCRAQLLAATGGAMKGEISEERLLDLRVPLPPLPVQAAIVSHWKAAQEKTAEKRLIADRMENDAKAHFLDVLGIAKQAATFQKKCFSLGWKDMERWSLDYLKRDIAVSKSGDKETLWKFHPLGELSNGKNGATPSTRNEAFWEGDIPWVSPKDMKVFRLTKTIDSITTEAIRQSTVPLIKGPSILMVVRSGILQHSVPVAFVERDVSINQDIRAFTIKPEVGLAPEFLAIFLQCSTESLLKLVKSSVTVQSINTADLEGFFIPLPPLDVQCQLIAEMNAARKKIASERAAAAKLVADTAHEIEEMILGQRPASEIGVSKVKKLDI